MYSLFGAPLKACQGPHNCLLGPHKLSFGAHKLYFRTFKGPLRTKMGPFGAWTLSKLCKYHSKIPKRIQRALIGLQKDYFEPKNTEKCLGFAIEKKNPIVQGLLGPPGAPLGLWGPEKNSRLSPPVYGPAMGYCDRSTESQMDNCYIALRLRLYLVLYSSVFFTESQDALIVSRLAASCSKSVRM